MSFRRSTVPEFSIAGVTFTCWITEENDYVWRSACGRTAVGRGGRTFWARADGQGLGTGYVTLRLAMLAAAKAIDTGRAAA